MSETTEESAYFTVGMLGAKVPRELMDTGGSAYLNEVRFMMIEKRILDIEATLERQAR